MTELVLDASAALAFLLKSQSTAASDRFLREEVGPFQAPDIFGWEVPYVLMKQARRSRYTPKIVETLLAQLAKLDVELAAPVVSPARDRLITFALRRDLSLFDAAYVDLALRSGLPLAARDEKMLAVAADLAIDVIDLGPNA